MVAKTAVFGENNRPATKTGQMLLHKFVSSESSHVGMRITTLIARVDQEWKSRATGNIENKRYKTTTTPPPQKKNTAKKQHKAKKNGEQ